MKKVRFFLLFAISVTVIFFSAIPCMAENSLKNNNINSYYSIPPSEVFYYNNRNAAEILNIPRPPTSKRPNKLEYQEPANYPEASEDYKGEFYW